jgi:hypothetical protein
MSAPDDTGVCNTRGFFIDPPVEHKTQTHEYSLNSDSILARPWREPSSIYLLRHHLTADAEKRQNYHSTIMPLNNYERW